MLNKKLNTDVLLLSLVAMSCVTNSNKRPVPAEESMTWSVDFLDNFDTFDENNWQDQRIWVTREVSDGTLKIKVVNVGEQVICNNLEKHGNQHPDTEYVAGCIASKNRQEFIKVGWTARLKLWGKGVPSTFSRLVTV